METVVKIIIGLWIIAIGFCIGFKVRDNVIRKDLEQGKIQYEMKVQYEQVFQDSTYIYVPVDTVWVKLIP
jgi:hypothetical protein